MNHEFFDPKEPWPKSEPAVELCHKHDKTLVSYWDDECPLCKAEALVKKLKLERLMFKADGKAWYWSDSFVLDRASRWHKLYEACKKELEK